MDFMNFSNLPNLGANLGTYTGNPFGQNDFTTSQFMRDNFMMPPLRDMDFTNIGDAYGLGNLTNPNQPNFNIPEPSTSRPKPVNDGPRPVTDMLARIDGPIRRAPSGAGGSGLPEGYSYDRPMDGIYTSVMPSSGMRYAYGPDGDRIEVPDNRSTGGTPPVSTGPLGGLLTSLLGGMGAGTGGTRGPSDEQLGDGMPIPSIDVGGPVPIRGPQPVLVGGPAYGGMKDATPINVGGPAELPGGPIPVKQPFGGGQFVDDDFIDGPRPLPGFDVAPIPVGGTAVPPKPQPVSGLPSLVQNSFMQLPTSPMRDNFMSIDRFNPIAMPFGMEEGRQIPDDAKGLQALAKTEKGKDVVRKMGYELQAGGLTPSPEELQEVQMAILGQMPNNQQVIDMFVEKYGNEIFVMIREQVLNPEGNRQTQGMIEGMGGGMDDQVLGMIGSQQAVAVSPGEYIVPADVVSGLGDGSSDAGAKELDGLLDRVRKERTNTTKQPKELNKGKVLPK